MTLEEAFDQFAAFTDALGNGTYLGGEMSQELDNLAYQMRRLAPMDRGRLRNSIALLADSTGADLSVVLELVEYGLYQNYGVSPNARSPFRTLDSTMADRRQPYGVTVENVSLGDYSYSNRNFGLPATVFFDYETLLDQVATIVENTTIEVIENNL
jgi:hypothetical protein